MPLEVEIIPEGAASGQIVCRSNFRHMYWNMRVIGSPHSQRLQPSRRRHDGHGTIGGAEKGSFGSMLEISWRGTRLHADGTERKFIQDGDTVVMRAPFFGSVIGQVLPAMESWQGNDLFRITEDETDKPCD